MEEFRCERSNSSQVDEASLVAKRSGGTSVRTTLLPSSDFNSCPFPHGGRGRVSQSEKFGLAPGNLGSRPRRLPHCVQGRACGDPRRQHICILSCSARAVRTGLAFRASSSSSNCVSAPPPSSTAKERHSVVARLQCRNGLKPSSGC